MCLTKYNIQIQIHDKTLIFDCVDYYELTIYMIYTILNYNYNPCQLKLRKISLFRQWFISYFNHNIEVWIFLSPFISAVGMTNGMLGEKCRLDT